MKKRLEALEAKQKTNKTDNEQIISLAKAWQKAVRSRNLKRAVSIRENAQPLFDKHPDWIDDPKDLRLSKKLYIEWEFFTSYLQPDIQSKYNQAIKEGINPGLTLIPKS